LTDSANLKPFPEGI